MNPDPFESRLKELPLRSLPTSWRREILAAAERKPSPLLSWLPGRWVTTPLTVAWLVILFLRVDTPSPEPFTGPGISPQAFAEAQQEKMLLIASIETASSEAETPVLTWPFPFDKRPL